MTRTLTTAIAYFDSQDPNNEGWAYRLTYDDGHQESGAMDAASDESGEVVSELEAMITGNGGEVDGVGVSEGAIQYYDSGEGSYRWARADEEA